jgi:hypothetical protein
MSTSQNKASKGDEVLGLAFFEPEHALAFSQLQTEGKINKLDPHSRAALKSALAYLKQFWRPAKLTCLICQRDISGSGDRTRVPSGEIVVVVPFALTKRARLVGGLCEDCALKPQVEKEAETWAAIGRVTGIRHTRIEQGRA